MDWKKEGSKFDWKMNKEKIILIFCAGLLLFVLSMPGGEGKKKAETSPDPAETKGQEAPSDITYEEQLEQRVRSILSGVDGVGNVDVLIVLQASEEKVWRVDKTTSVSQSEESDGEDKKRLVTSREQSENTVMDSGSAGGEALLEKELRPQISGIVIAADGGGSATVKAEISEAMEALFGLPQHKIKVLKRVARR